MGVFVGMLRTRSKEALTKLRARSLWHIRIPFYFVCAVLLFCSLGSIFYAVLASTDIFLHRLLVAVLGLSVCVPLVAVASQILPSAIREQNKVSARTPLRALAKTLRTSKLKKKALRRKNLKR